MSVVSEHVCAVYTGSARDRLFAVFMSFARPFCSVYIMGSVGDFTRCLYELC